MMAKILVPAGKGAKDLAQPSCITLRSSEITTYPSAAIPQYNFNPPSEPCIKKNIIHRLIEMLKNC